MMQRLLVVEEVMVTPQGTVLLPPLDALRFREPFAVSVELKRPGRQSITVLALLAQDEVLAGWKPWAIVLDLPEDEVPPGTEVWADLPEAAP